MPRIKNWKKVKIPQIGDIPTPSSKALAWDNQVDTVSLVVAKTKPSRQRTDRKWFVETRRQRGKGFIRFFDTKKEAKNFAVEWMRQNPSS